MKERRGESLDPKPHSGGPVSLPMSPFRECLPEGQVEKGGRTLEDARGARLKDQPLSPPRHPGRDGRAEKKKAFSPLSVSRRRGRAEEGLAGAAAPDRPLALGFSRRKRGQDRNFDAPAYGRLRRQRLVDHAPHRHCMLTSIIGALRLGGVGACMTVEAALWEPTWRALGSKPWPGRRGGHGQPVQPQAGCGRGIDRSARSQRAMAAALQPRSQPDRENVEQAQAIAAQDQGPHRAGAVGGHSQGTRRRHGRGRLRLVPICGYASDIERSGSARAFGRPGSSCTSLFLHRMEDVDRETKGQSIGHSCDFTSNPAKRSAVQSPSC